MATLIENIRNKEDLVFLFDAGDMITGSLSNRTGGEVLMEMMITMRYDAMAMGNHEFDYGWENIREQKNRLPFPVLGANIYYKGTDIRFAQPYAVLERDGFRIGVIGILGQDAGYTTIMPSHVTKLEFRDPVPIVREIVEKLRPDVDLIVLLTHMGHTAPMQTDDEAHPELQRDLNADIALSGAVEGIDVHFGGHADVGTEKPLVNPQTGTLIMQTYGQGVRLGYLKLVVDTAKDTVLSYDGKLIVVDSDNLEPHPGVAAKIAKYRAHHPELQEKLATSDLRLTRVYQGESDLGNLICDIMRERTGTDIAFYISGGIRDDLPQGDVTLGDVLNVCPYKDTLQVVELTGAQIVAVLEQGLTGLRGITQVSGLTAWYDRSRPEKDRVLKVEISGRPIDPAKTYRVAAHSFLAQGGDHYDMFRDGKIISSNEPLVIDVLIDEIRQRAHISRPTPGRLISTR